MCDGQPIVSIDHRSTVAASRVVRRLVATVVIVLLGTADASAWSSPAHQAIGEAAQSRLTPQARAALARILQDTDTLSPGALAGVATWADDVRARARHQTVADGWGPADIDEADQFNADNPGNALWHFVDLTLGATAYPATDPPTGDPLKPFVTSDDIVHALGRCIAILEAPTADPKFSKRQAVRWIVHLVGDLHQPMHVRVATTRRPSRPSRPSR
jgi:S1/P1 Nuclease